MTPGYPSNYEDDVICNWEVTSSIQTTIRLTFNDFETEECCDELKIYDGPSMNGNMMAFKRCCLNQNHKLKDVSENWIFCSHRHFTIGPCCLQKHSPYKNGKSTVPGQGYIP